MLQVGEDHWQEGNQHDAQGDQAEMLLNERNVAEEVTAAHTDQHPSKPADEVVMQEVAVVHVAAAGNKRSKSPNNGDEACNSNRLAAMFIEEILGDLEFISINEAAEERIVAGGQAHVMTWKVIWISPCRSTM